MSLYLIALIILVLFSIYEIQKGTTQKRLYYISLFVLSVMLCLRYGQGTDYFGYFYNFLLTPSLLDVDALRNSALHGEPVWLLICAFFQTFHIPFEVLVFLISAIMMYCLHRFVTKYSPMWTVSLLLAYPTLYLTYAMSALRQGLVLMIFLGFMVDWLYQGRVKKYLIATVACMLIHSSALVFLLLLGVRLFTLDTRKSLITMLVAVIAGVASSKIFVAISSSVAYYADAGISIMAVGERVLSTAVILYVFHDVLEGKAGAKNDKLTFLLQIYLYGSIIYCGLMWSSLLASRFGVYFKAVEIVLFAVAAKDKTRMARTVALYILALTVIMYFKNIASYISQGNYCEAINIWNYPYVSVFWKELIVSLRAIPYDLSVFPNLLN